MRRGIAQAAARESLRREIPEGPPRLGGQSIALNLEYRLPPCSPLTDADAARLDALDLLEMDRDELSLELGRVKLVRMFGDMAHAPVWAASWLRERQRRIEYALKDGPR